MWCIGKGMRCSWKRVWDRKEAKVSEVGPASTIQLRLCGSANESYGTDGMGRSYESSTLVKRGWEAGRTRSGTLLNRRFDTIDIMELVVPQSGAPYPPPSLSSSLTLSSPLSPLSSCYVPYGVTSTYLTYPRYLVPLLSFSTPGC